MNAQIYKKKIKGFLYAKTYGGVVEESVNHWNADIIGVTFRHEVNEFEIKCSVNDLRGEIKAIKRALRGDIYKNQSQNNLFSYNRVEVEEKVSLTKLEKHYCYLVGNKKQSMSFTGTIEEERQLKEADDNVTCFVPDKFYFAVPTTLVPIAKELLQDVPYYGVMDADTGEIKKNAKRIPRAHSTKTDIVNLFMRACTEWRLIEYGIEHLQDIMTNGHPIRVKKKYVWTDYNGKEHIDYI